MCDMRNWQLAMRHATCDRNHSRPVGSCNCNWNCRTLQFEVIYLRQLAVTIFGCHWNCSTWPMPHASVGRCQVYAGCICTSAGCKFAVSPDTDTDHTDHTVHMAGACVEWHSTKIQTYRTQIAINGKHAVMASSHYDPPV